MKAIGFEAMGIEFRPLSQAIGAEAIGVDLSAPIADRTFALIRDACLKSVILLFRGLDRLSPESQIAFCRRFGPIEIHRLAEYHLPGYPEIFIVSNVKNDGKPIGAIRVGQNWHTDHYHLKTPASVTFLRAIEVPPDQGDTLFANMYAAYEALPEETRRRIAPLEARHSRARLNAQVFADRPEHVLSDFANAEPDVLHSVVRRHPKTGRRALYLGSELASEIVGLPHDEAKALYRELLEFATRPCFVYRHRWRAGDAILSDNRCSMHFAIPFDEACCRRTLWRTIVLGDEPR